MKDAIETILFYLTCILVLILVVPLEGVAWVGRKAQSIIDWLQPIEN